VGRLYGSALGGLSPMRRRYPTVATAIP
jgi:hypothetical protein